MRYFDSLRPKLSDSSFTVINVANLCRGKTCQGAPDVASRRLGQAEAYFTVREVLPEAGKGVDGVHWGEFSGFGRFRFATVRVYPERLDLSSSTGLIEGLRMTCLAPTEFVASSRIAQLL
jgi:hypothetical protein